MGLYIRPAFIEKHSYDAIKTELMKLIPTRVAIEDIIVFKRMYKKTGGTYQSTHHGFIYAPDKVYTEEKFYIADIEKKAKTFYNSLNKRKKNIGNQTWAELKYFAKERFGILLPDTLLEPEVEKSLADIILEDFDGIEFCPGFHSWDRSASSFMQKNNTSDVDVKCIIPAGAKYLVGFGNDENTFQQYVSDKIVFVEEVNDTIESEDIKNTCIKK